MRADPLPVAVVLGRLGDRDRALGAGGEERVVGDRAHDRAVRDHGLDRRVRRRVPVTDEVGLQHDAPRRAARARRAGSSRGVPKRVGVETERAQRGAHGGVDVVRRTAPACRRAAARARGTACPGRTAARAPRSSATCARGRRGSSRSSCPTRRLHRAELAVRLARDRVHVARARRGSRRRAARGSPSAASARSRRSSSARGTMQHLDRVAASPGAICASATSSCSLKMWSSRPTRRPSGVIT